MQTEQAILLGVIQGITEFFPISSSGHLILTPHFLGWELQSLTFDTALHLGTVLALLGNFWEDLLRIFKTKERILVLTVATIPAALGGLVLGDLVETARSPILVAVNLIIFGLLLFVGEEKSSEKKETGEVGIKEALFIGLFQTIALFPGVSRSGITITAGLFKNLKKEAAARFSFIIGIPIIFGAGLLKLSEAYVNGQMTNLELAPLLIGTSVSALTGFLVVRFLLQYLRTHSLKPFVIYRIILALVIILTLP